jgi:DNA-binding transcriptional LysR family regulator
MAHTHFVLHHRIWSAVWGAAAVAADATPRPTSVPPGATSPPRAAQSDLLHATLVEHRRRFPEVETHLVDGSSDHLISDLARSAVDIAFVAESGFRREDSPPTLRHCQAAAAQA